MKENKGITLIALVITIVVLIILAGISISIMMGEDGLITKAKMGAQNYQNAAVEEKDMLNTIGIFTDLNGSANGSGTGTNIQKRQAQTITPGTEDVIIPAGTYLEGDLTIKGNSNLKPEYIKNGVSIFGITGTLNDSATANSFTAYNTYTATASDYNATKNISLSQGNYIVAIGGCGEWGSPSTSCTVTGGAIKELGNNVMNFKGHYEGQITGGCRLAFVSITSETGTVSCTFSGRNYVGVSVVVAQVN